MLALSSLDTGNGNMKPPVWPSVAWVHASLKTLFLLWICVKGKSVEMVGGYWGWALESTTLLSSPRTSLRNLALASNSKVKRSWRFFLHRPPMRVFDRNEKTCKCPCTLCVTNKVITKLLQVLTVKTWACWKQTAQLKRKLNKISNKVKSEDVKALAPPCVLAEWRPCGTGTWQNWRSMPRQTHANTSFSGNSGCWNSWCPVSTMARCFGAWQKLDVAAPRRFAYSH